jgi:hypothetical protein
VAEEKESSSDASMTSNLDSTMASRFLAPKPLLYIHLVPQTSRTDPKFQIYRDSVQFRAGSIYISGAMQKFAVAAIMNETKRFGNPVVLFVILYLREP